ncbi:carbamoyl-phosphate synthase small subunit [Pyrobaculum aerophilum str. IM2]|uniref:Carbamoyl phosphate synthase small chain n=2 Tax=Pyrobaculum aerophilum TaxID=13773 RepID=CARA_PYRAE|nr:carbamoyl-phosphate synthase small subunit [Pyrobaculum aerophilum]Q8ZY49.1 RecName: Full=Carbamoyl phosphate synthase small chain; AltName: Full=Carbamoyl phosphate synthetase glutamine chain [Pyrobaculum aerophilum str. IM2]AAL63147.1 carbamoyl-phosphate synthase small subunit [Pyrobaculum aerophilum str. IM2]HII48091.1 carbamoyl-phosphate synthase small subunit [Pyrobaculum aerophilum]
MEDGSVFAGRLIGAEKIAVGEVVFTTSVVGYPQTLTDPSYKGQIITFTMPLIGNYGVSEDQLESDGIKAEGVVLFEATFPSHYKSVMSLEEWLASSGVPGVARVDTRALVQMLREHGVMMGAIGPEDPAVLMEALRKSPHYEDVVYVDMVSVKEPVLLGEGRLCIGVVDCGVKRSIVREFLKRGVRVKLVPCRRTELAFDCDALFISNGPGNPKLLDFLSAKVSEYVEYKKPLMGICLGHQVIAMALGAGIYKLKFGHRASNKPVRDIRFTGRTYITTHNHGYAVDPRGTDLKVWAVQPDDGTVEGLYHERLPILTTQWHPEASPGPQDTRWVFDKFLKLVERHGH